MCYGKAANVLWQFVAGRQRAAVEPPVCCGQFVAAISMLRQEKLTDTHGHIVEALGFDSAIAVS
jgi:hypothetical protein